MKVSIPTELQRALTAARIAVEGRQKIETAISQAIGIQPAAEADLQAALALLGDLEAGSILSGVPAPTGEAQKRLTAARDHVSALEARIAALRRRLIESEDGILSAHAAIGPVRAEFTAKCTAEFELEYKKAASAFLEVLQAGSSLSDSLGVTFCGLAETEIYDLFEAVNPMRVETSGRPASIAHDPVIAVRDQSLAIERIADGIAKARAAREAEKAPKPIDRGSGYLGVSQAPHHQISPPVGQHHGVALVRGVQSESVA
jgi:hypothetical protein